MKKTKMITAIIIVLALTVLAGEALAGPGGGGRGRGGGPGWGRRMAGGPQSDTDLDSIQPDNYWRPGPYCPFGQDPNQNIQGWQGRGFGRFYQGFQGPRGPYCPYGQGPNQNIQGWQGRGPGGFGQGPNQNIQGRQGPGPGGFGQRFMGRGQRPCVQVYGHWNMIMKWGPMAGRGGRGAAIQGRGGRGFQRPDMAPQGWGMNNWQDQSGPGGIGRPGLGMQQRWSAPEDTDQPTPPRGRGWAPGIRQGWGPGWKQNWTPNWEPDLQPEKAPDANVPAEPVVEDQTEKPQGE